jgi:hypothetical protein
MINEKKVTIDEFRRSEGEVKIAKCRERSRKVCVTNQEKRRMTSAENWEGIRNRTKSLNKAMGQRRLHRESTPPSEAHPAFSCRTFDDDSDPERGRRTTTKTVSKVASFCPQTRS